MRRLEDELETASERLSVAAGGPPTPRPARAAAPV
jgi:1-acyl-sn-glycerol-3-phosphate acyltransferase